MNIKIKYLSNEIDKIEKMVYGDWIDLRCAQTVSLRQGEHALIPLGVAMRLPYGYEGHIVPRSSTFKNYKIIQTNHMGVVDNSYSGDEDEWKMSVYALEDTTINVNERICQFRIVKRQPQFEFEEVETLGNKSRGGFGSTGKV